MPLHQPRLSLPALLNFGAALACPGCSLSPQRCQCASEFGTWRVNVQSSLLPRRFPVVAAAAYAGNPRTLVVQWKERSHVVVNQFIAAALADTVRAAYTLSEVAAHPASPLHLVPVPARMRSLVTRGGNPLQHVTSLAAAHLRQAGLPCQVSSRWLSRTSGVDQVGLSASERQLNATKSYRLRRPPEHSATVILIDDIVTTGSTLAACRTLLCSAGLEVVAAAAVCATNVFPLAANRHTVGTPTG